MHRFIYGAAQPRFVKRQLYLAYRCRERGLGRFGGREVAVVFWVADASGDPLAAFEEGHLVARRVHELVHGVGEAGGEFAAEGCTARRARFHLLFCEFDMKRAARRGWGWAGLDWGNINNYRRRGLKSEVVPKLQPAVVFFRVCEREHVATGDLQYFILKQTEKIVRTHRSSYEGDNQHARLSNNMTVKRINARLPRSLLLIRHSGKRFHCANCNLPP